MGYDEVKFESDTKFLITGGAGFIGSNLVEVLLEMGYFVRVLDNLSTGKIENILPYMDSKKFEFIEGDIRDYSTCEESVKNIDFVLHQAALGSVPRSMKYPLIYEDNNIKGTSNMMEASRNEGVKKFVYASSSSVYGDSNILPKKEGEEGLVLSPYALSKKVNELYGKIYTDHFNLPCIGLRYFNVYGKRQDPFSAYAAVIPKFVKSLLDNNPISIYGDGEQSRDFTFIENVIEANLKACISNDLSNGRAYNIAFGERCTINEMYSKMKYKLNIDLDPIYTEERPGDIKHSLADITAARELINYNPSWTFEKGFNSAVDWYIKNL
jgi:UDP-N-acetylglucosamine 4-epimerase